MSAVTDAGSDRSLSNVDLLAVYALCGVVLAAAVVSFGVETCFRGELTLAWMKMFK